jgi:hypothetical protein
METPHKGVLLGTLICTIKLEQEQDTSWPNHSKEWETPLGIETVLTTWGDHIYKMAEKACVYVYVYVFYMPSRYLMWTQTFSHTFVPPGIKVGVWEEMDSVLLLQELQGLGRGENFNNGQKRTWALTRASTVLLRTSTEPALFGVRWYKVPFLSSSWCQICW